MLITVKTINLKILGCLLLTFAQLGYSAPQSIQTIVENAIPREQVVGMSIGVVVGDKTYFFNYGYQNKRNRKKISENTIFEIGSVTKTFTGTLLALANNEGVLQLNDVIDNYLPEPMSLHPQMRNQITFVNLATHTSGLPRALGSGISHITYEQFIERLRRWHSPFLPGTRAQYSNTGFQILGYLVSLAYGKSYEELLQSKIASPLNMSSTALQIANELLLADGHDKNKNEIHKLERNPWNGIGVIHSTTKDLARFLIPFLKERPSSPLEDAIHLVKQQHFISSPQAASGLGLSIKVKQVGDSLVRQYAKNGATPGYSSFIGFIPQFGIGIVVLSNTRHRVTKVGNTILNRYLENIL